MKTEVTSSNKCLWMRNVFHCDGENCVGSFWFRHVFLQYTLPGIVQKYGHRQVSILKQNKTHMHTHTHTHTHRKNIHRFLHAYPVEVNCNYSFVAKNSIIKNNGIIKY